MKCETTALRLFREIFNRGASVQSSSKINLQTWWWCWLARRIEGGVGEAEDDWVEVGRQQQRRWANHVIVLLCLVRKDQLIQQRSWVRMGEAWVADVYEVEHRLRDTRQYSDVLYNFPLCLRYVTNSLNLSGLSQFSSKQSLGPRKSTRETRHPFLPGLHSDWTEEGLLWQSEDNKTILCFWNEFFFVKQDWNQ